MLYHISIANGTSKYINEFCVTSKYLVFVLNTHYMI